MVRFGVGASVLRRLRITRIDNDFFDEVDAQRGVAASGRRRIVRPERVPGPPAGGLGLAA